MAGHRARVYCGQGHKAVFIFYRDKIMDPALGPVTLRSAWYPCADCRQGLAPATQSSGSSARPCRLGLAAMNDTAAR